jgi:SAM-dependent methyltransferase
MEHCRDYFTRNLLEGSRRSAEVVVPLVMQLVRPASVVDVGCGTGGWLAAFRSRGVRDVLGLDGDWAPREMLEIPEENFRAFDLREPLRLGRHFDLVLCLEVAQHLPGECAGPLVRSLTDLGPVVLFSAAVPHQGGVCHVNEQWPGYWARLFDAWGYAAVDCLRDRIWENDEVEWWFAQNLLLFAARDRLRRLPALAREGGQVGPSALPRVHPRKYLQMAEWADRLAAAAGDVEAAVPPEETLILADQGELQGMVAAGRRALPFPECDGWYGGPPEDDGGALAELGRLRRRGGRFLAFAWPAFWWLEHYAGFHRHLRARFRCVLDNDRLVVFDLRTPAEPAGGVPE